MICAQVPVPAAEREGLPECVRVGSRTVHRHGALRASRARLSLAARAPDGRRTRAREYLHGRSREPAAVGWNHVERSDTRPAPSAHHTTGLTNITRNECTLMKTLNALYRITKEIVILVLHFSNPIIAVQFY